MHFPENLNKCVVLLGKYGMCQLHYISYFGWDALDNLNHV